jgi:uncharacterized protein YbjT (DUF2867 family)
MRVLVTGATGRLGRVLLPRLVGAGHTVRAMSRTDRTGGAAEWVRADLATGAGLFAAVAGGGAAAGVEAVMHLASAPYRRGYTREVDVAGTERLIGAAAAAGVAHLLYVSIVGVDRVPWRYFRHKVAAEQLVRSGGVPWTIVRVTQFHSFLDEILTRVRRLPVLVTDPAIPAQPVDVRDAADYLAARLAGGPGRAVEEFGGPEVLRGDAPVRDWLAARGVHRPVVRVRVPGALGRAFRSGALTTGAEPTGSITWRDYLAGR